MIPELNKQYHFFDDGKIVDYDTTEDLKAAIFEPLRDIKKFKNACTVMNGTLAWDISGKMDETENCCGRRGDQEKLGISEECGM